jgi:lipid II:glycine glycyltransferase (peptidoglycan interpeptide bridge formation enzyme)
LVFQFQPLTDARWQAFLQRHPRSSVFHTVAWLEALRRTYGYEPVAFTTTPPGDELRDAVLFCRVDSWLTGKRLVSVPFSDHCDVLVDTPTELTAIMSALEKNVTQEHLRYVELRSTHLVDTVAAWSHSTSTYFRHQLDVSPDVDTLFENLHKDSTQRKILRAQREGLTCREGRSTALLNDFYRLLLLTRRRHSIPPQPKHWFENLIDCFGDMLTIRVAFRRDQPIASVLTLHHKAGLFYKYGCSDARFHNLGGMHLLLWRSIQEAKREGMRRFDLGRSDVHNTGLAIFKDRLGAERFPLTYFRVAAAPARSSYAFAPGGIDWMDRAAKRALPRLPDRLLCAAGSLLYRHIG